MLDENVHDKCKHAVLHSGKVSSVAAENVMSLEVTSLFQLVCRGPACLSWQTMYPIALLCCAGFFLFAVQPFRLGDRIAVRSMASGDSAASSPGPTGGWYEGCCEQVDLRQAPLHQAHMVDKPEFPAFMHCIVGANMFGTRAYLQSSFS